MPYSPVIVIGYNANPPADDGTQVTTNEISWAKHIEKIGGPLKTAIESIDSNVEDIITEIEADIAVLQANLTAPSGTVMLFGSAAPSGWTTQNTYNDYGLRLVGTSGTPGAVSGDISWSAGLADRTIALANLPDYDLSFSLTADAHTHGSGDYEVESHSHSDGSLSANSHAHSNGSLDAANGRASLSVNSSKRTNNQGSQNVNYSLSNSTIQIGGSTSSASAGVSGSTGSSSPDVQGSSGSSSTSVSGTISSDGDGTAMNFDIQTYDVILATKD